MKYATPDAFRVALEQRLLARSKGAGLALPRLRKAVVFDRFLARLLVVAPDRWHIKGGLALDLRYGARARSTKDMDLGYGDADEATEDLMAASGLDLGDFFRFVTTRTSQLDVIQEGAAIRFQLAATLAGRRFENVQIDVGFGKSNAPGSDRVPGTDLLVFAGIDQIEIPTLPIEYHVAEKLHAYTQTFADQRTNTRTRDLIDLVLIRSNAVLSAGKLREALAVTFSGRGADSIPVVLPPPPAIWEQRYRVLTEEVALDPDITVGYRLAATFLNPVLDGSVSDDARWDPHGGDWQSPNGS